MDTMYTDCRRNRHRHLRAGPPRHRRADPAGAPRRVLAQRALEFELFLERRPDYPERKIQILEPAWHCVFKDVEDNEAHGM